MTSFDSAQYYPQKASSTAWLACHPAPLRNERHLRSQFASSIGAGGHETLSQASMKFRAKQSREPAIKSLPIQRVPELEVRANRMNCWRRASLSQVSSMEVGGRLQHDCGGPDGETLASNAATLQNTLFLLA